MPVEKLCKDGTLLVKHHKLVCIAEWSKVSCYSCQLVSLRGVCTLGDVLRACRM